MQSELQKCVKYITWKTTHLQLASFFFLLSFWTHQLLLSETHLYFLNLHSWVYVSLLLLFLSYLTTNPYKIIFIS